jgi:hypothetical protein
VIVELDYDPLIGVGHNRAKTELLVFDLGTLRKGVGCHMFARLYSSVGLLGKECRW